MPKIPTKFIKILSSKSFILLSVFLLVSFLSLILSASLFLAISQYQGKNKEISEKLKYTQNELNFVKGQDQFVKNKSLEEEIKNIHNEYLKAVSSYEKILDFKLNKGKTDQIDSLFASALHNLSERNYSSASADISKLNALIEKESTIAQTIPTPVRGTVEIKQSNQPPASGYSRQTVNTENGSFTVDIIAADLNSTKVVVDSASDKDCFDNCPVLTLSDYVGRSGAYAGINGSYFCPASYPTCAGKTNSFDLLVMNKNKFYFNSSNNVYSTNPAAIFYGNSARFVGRALEWGRDTGVDAVISNYPLLLSGGNVVADGGVKATKTFIGNKGSMAYIGIVRNATVGEAARVLKALGLENAMGLDQGGSTALMFNGSYIAGPGRNIPNAVLFLRK